MSTFKIAFTAMLSFNHFCFCSPQILEVEGPNLIMRRFVSDIGFTPSVCAVVNFGVSRISLEVSKCSFYARRCFPCNLSLAM
jgi:hypothetical protein